MKLISTLRGPEGFEYLGIDSIYVIHDGEKNARPCEVGAWFKISDRQHWSDTVGAVAGGKICPKFPPGLLKCRVLRPLTTRVGGKQVSANVGEVVEVEPTVETAQAIARRLLQPLDSSIWAPTRLTWQGRLREIAGGAKRK